MRERIEQFCYTKKDFKLDWFSGTGKGGQHRNKHQNCLRLTHIPSGITVTAQDGRDRPGNQRTAFERLRPKLAAWIQEQISRDKISGKSDELVRTYHEPDNRITDHASGLQIRYSDMDGRFDELVDARLLADKSDRRESGMSTLAD